MYNIIISGDFMKYEIDKNIDKEYIINKSRFICLLFKISSTDEVDSILNSVKNEYKSATHYCYAYIVQNIEKCSDDKEPSGTAGIPILNVIKKNSLTNILCVVVRYFGGIKLGSGGLIRAYSSVVSGTLKDININEYVEYELINIIVNYDNLNKVKYIINNYEIINELYSEEVILTVKIPKNKLQDIINKLENFCKIKHL